MAGFYHTFVSTRTTKPDPTSLANEIRALDATAGIRQEEGTNNFIIKKNTPFTQAHINAAQNVIDNAPESSPRLTAQAYFDSLPIVERAIILVQLDQFNLIRSKLDPPLAQITEAQMFTAIRNKIGNL